MEKNNRPIMVSVRCTVFNHEKYLRQCLEGIVKQQTNFRYEVIVHDDVSTDNSVSIIKEYELKYPDVIKPIYETVNQYSKHDGTFYKIISDACKGKYVANCEGDDYWTDPLKLQKQVDFLEANPDYTMCFHSVDRVLDGSVVGRVSHFDKECDVTPYMIIHEGGLYCPFCSMVYRREYLDDWPTFRKIADVGDGPLAILLSLRGKVRYFPDVMGCYRLFAEGSWSSNNQKSPERLYKHFLSGHKWYKELNSYTGGKYKNAVYHRICMTSVFLYKNGVINKQTLLDNFSQLSWGKDKLHHYIYYLKLEHPKIRKAGQFIKQIMRNIKKIWQKKKN